MHISSNAVEQKDAAKIYITRPKISIPYKYLKAYSTVPSFFLPTDTHPPKLI